MLKKLLPLIFLFTGFQVNAAIIVDNDTYTTVDGLDWLDWTATMGQTQAAALGDNAGYRGATYAEQVHLNEAMFGTTFTYDSDGFDVSFDEIANATKIIDFIALFGATAIGGRSYAMSEGAGLVGFDGPNRFMLAGLYPHIWGAAGASASTIGIALVRSSAVPEPSIIALCGLGLVGIGFARRRRQS
ncbi:hypothetical protein CXF95_03350 [Paraglaciecola sp. MB-3u-78]|nr:hypothetical protein CXF95_03350 [Paraglaciecola sp. MB-3u-78]